MLVLPSLLEREDADRQMGEAVFIKSITLHLILQTLYMKNILTLFIVTTLITLSACNGKTSATVENLSANQKVYIKITGSRGNALDPFKTEISIKAYDLKPGKLIMEIMAPDLNSENVKFNWQDDNHCTITITEQDDHTRTFQLIADENQLQLAEV